MSEAADQRFAPPQAHVADLAPEQAVLAGRGTRLLAAIVDGLILAAAVWAVLMIPALTPLMRDDADVWAFDPWSMLVGVGVFFAVQGWPLLARAQTIGKMLFKLRIVRTDGSRPDAFRLLGLRYGVGMLMGVSAGLSMVYSLIDSLLIFRASRQCLHDSIADTQVIKL